MNKTFSLKYLDACASGFFQGFGGHVYAVPLSPRPRNGEVLSGLLDCIRGEELFIDGESAPDAAYDQVRASAAAIFKGVDKRTRFSRFEFGEDAYAYFGVVIGEEAEGVAEAMTPEQIAALKRFAEDHGRCWKDKLLTYWTREILVYVPLVDRPYLRQIRNSHLQLVRKMTTAQLQAMGGSA